MDVPVEKGKELNLPFFEQPRFNVLRFRFLLQGKSAIALKTGIDNRQATLYVCFRRRLKGLA